MSTHNVSLASTEYQSFRDEITKRIRSAQYEALKAVNKEMIALYWEIGRRITEQQTTLGWGKSVVENLFKDIQKEFPGIKGFSARNMWDMARFYSEYQSNYCCPVNFPTVQESFSKPFRIGLRAFFFKKQAP